MDLDNNRKLELLAHIMALGEEKKREIVDHYAEVKLRIPSYLKNVTVDQLREAGATVGHDLVIPLNTDNHYRKLSRLKEKLTELRDAHIEQVKKYYDNVKKGLPKSLLEKKISDLDESDWNTLGIDMARFRESLRNAD